MNARPARRLRKPAIMAAFTFSAIGCVLVGVLIGAYLAMNQIALFRSDF